MINFRFFKIFCYGLVCSLFLFLVSIVFFNKNARTKFDRIRDGDTTIYISEIEIMSKPYANGFTLTDQESISLFKDALSKNFDIQSVDCNLSNSWNGIVKFNRFETVEFSVSVCSNKDMIILSYPISIMAQDLHYGIRLDKNDFKSQTILKKLR